MMIHTWRKAGTCRAGDCIELRNDLAGLRDSKNPTSMLMVPIGALLRWVR